MKYVCFKFLSFNEYPQTAYVGAYRIRYCGLQIRSSVTLDYKSSITISGNSILIDYIFLHAFQPALVCIFVCRLISDIRFDDR